MTTLEQIRALAAQGIGRKAVEATIGRAMSADELDAWRKADTVRRLKIAAKKAKGPASGADRVAKHVSERNEVGEIPPPRHPRLKERCRYDLELFGWMYFRPFLKHRASADIRDTLIRDAQNCALSGGMTAELIARGGGKTTWIDIILPAWAVLYGHRSFPVTFGASMKAAKKNLKSVKRHFARSPEILADFPAIAIPIRQLGGIAQRCASQTYHGRPTDVEWGSDQITLPMLRDDSGQPLDAGCGAILAATGIGGAIRGANEGGKRPDMVLIDDPQTRKAAASLKMVQGILEYIHSDALALAGHDTTVAAFLTITPQRYGDVATEISTNPTYASNWSIKVQPFIKSFPPNWDEISKLFSVEYAKDAAAKDFTCSRSTAWYRENAALFEKMETIDPEQYDHAREIDVNHHLLNLRAKMGVAAFNAEILMRVQDKESALDIDEETVYTAINGYPRGVCPPETETVCGFCDVNIQAGAGLSWVLVAFARQRVAAIIDYGRFPSDGSPLVPKNAPFQARAEILSEAIMLIVRKMAARKIRDANGREVSFTAFGFDRGWEPKIVMRTVAKSERLIPHQFKLFTMLGAGWDSYGAKRKDIVRRHDHMMAVNAGELDVGRVRQKLQYLLFMAPYWREIMQSGFLAKPLMPGSLSLFGTDPTEHVQFAREICAERLLRKYQVYRNRRMITAWDWQTTGPEHWCDATTCSIAIASWFRAYDSLADIIDPVKLGVKFPVQGDLFDPESNPYASEADEIETEDEERPETEQEPAPKFKMVKSLAQSSPSAQTAISRRAAERQRALRKLAKFKKGKWRK